MKEAKVLIIDDDRKLAEALMDYLKKYSFVPEHVADPRQAIAAMKAFQPDLIILDIMMPEIDGLSLCKDIRKFSEIPIIFLSARGDTMDRIVGLELGADDYLPKPFEPRELVARIETVLRRADSPKEMAGDGPLQLSPDSMQVELNGQKLDFTATEFQALNYLYINRQKIVSRDELLTFLQGMDSEVYGRAIDILISRIRQKLGDEPKSSRFIKTIRGQGYRDVGEEA